VQVGATVQQPVLGSAHPGLAGESGTSMVVSSNKESQGSDAEDSRRKQQQKQQLRTAG